MTARFGRLAIGIALVGAALAYLVFAGTRKNLVYYYEIGELEAAAARTSGPIRLSGDVVAGTIEREPATRTLRFAIEAASGGATVPVAYSGTVPDIFRPGIQVVVEGRLGPDGTFQAETLLAKCPSKYQAAGQLGEPGAPGLPRS